MSVQSDPLLTDIYEMIRNQINGVENIRAVLGSDSNLRVFREFPQAKPNYPLMTMGLLTWTVENLDYLYIDYFVRLTLYTKSTNKADQDSVVLELNNLFSDPCKNYNQGQTKIEFIHPQPSVGETWDPEHRAHIYPMTLQIRARRKTSVN